ncbi:MAG: pyridoxal phosphate-dependent aminotransferase [Anaerovoracaceae bacterium]
MKSNQDRISRKIFEKPKEKGLFEINSIALSMEEKGQNIIHLEIGEPDFDTPDSIKEAAIRDLKAGDVHYTDMKGKLELRRAISDYERRRYGLDYDPDDQILVTAGASEALHDIWSALLNPGDEVLMPSPFYCCYREIITFNGGKMVEVPIIDESGQVRYDMDLFEQAVTDHTKMIIINSPNNPTGHIMTEEEIREIADFATKYDLLVVSDEVYDHFIFEGEFRTIAALPGMQERTLVVNSTSKTYAMTGWRVGFVAGPAELVAACKLIHGNEVVCPSAFAQIGAAYAFENEIPEVAEMGNEFQARRDYLESVLREKGMSYVAPQGAFYVFLDIGKSGMRGADFCEDLLRTKGVAMSPGSVFGSRWSNYVRISYASSMQNLKDAMKLLFEYYEEKTK